MSLLDAAMTKCTMIHKTTTPDGYGGERAVWVDGAEFYAAVSFDSSMVARVGQAQGVTNLYTVTTRKDKVLEFHEVFRRQSDGKIFRVTSDGDDKATPDSASLNMRVVTAEEWRIPVGG